MQEKWTIKLKTLKIGPGGTVYPGEIYEEDAKTAEQLIKTKQAILISKPEPPKPVEPEPKPIEEPEPVIIEERVFVPEELAIERKPKGKARKKRK